MKSSKPKRKPIKIEADFKKNIKEESLSKSFSNFLDEADDFQRLSFTEDPNSTNKLGYLFRRKRRLLPDKILKRISIQDSLVATIVRARQQHLSSFGRPRPTRFDTGFELKPNQGLVDRLNPEEKKQLNTRIEKAVQFIWNCGLVVENDKKEIFSEYLSITARDAVTVGRVSTEKIYDKEQRFIGFRAVDSSTISEIVPDSQASAESVRRSAKDILERFKKSGDLESLDTSLFSNKEDKKDKYAYIQVIDGRAHQAFTDKEMIVHNFYPASDIELEGFPITPLDTVISAVTTHINISTHNKLYFQSGRATRGMLICKSDDITTQELADMRQAMQANINSVQNSWRMPVFKHGTDEEISWQPIDMAGSKDGEFQYLTDMNAREILSAFGMSPDELPGYQHLSRGSNSQTLSESNNEFKLVAARDVGIRPLLSSFEDMFNTHILPEIDPGLATKVQFRLVGLDALNAEKESVRLQQDAPLHMTYDELLEAVEKKPLGKKWGGEIPLNPVFWSYINQLFTVGQILENFCGWEGASDNPELNYRANAYHFQQAQIMMGIQAQNQEQAQSQDQNQEQDQQAGENIPFHHKDEGPADLARSIDQAYDLMNKSEDSLPPNRRKILAQHKKTIDYFLNGWEKDSKVAQDEILKVAKNFRPKK